MPVILLEFSMTPLTKGESVSKYVARSLDIIDKSGLDYRLNPMGTVIEGEWDKVDYRKGKTGRITAKIESVEKRLKKKLKT